MKMPSGPLVAAAAAAALCVVCLVGANQPDVFFPSYLPPASCEHGCAPWAAVKKAQQPVFDKPAEAGSTCAIPGASTGKETDVTNAYGGPFCFCATAENASSGVAAYCHQELGTPEQINLQLANNDTVVVAFVTYVISPRRTSAFVCVMVTRERESQKAGVQFVCFMRLPAPK